MAPAWKVALRKKSDLVCLAKLDLLGGRTHTQTHSPARVNICSCQVGASSNWLNKKLARLKIYRILKETRSD